MDVADDETEIEPPTTGAVILTLTEPVREIAEAVTVTLAALAPAVRITVAMPLKFVVAVGLDKVAAVLLRLNVTLFPAIGLPELSKTTAEIEVVPAVTMVAWFAETVTVPVVIVTEILLLTLPDVAVIVTIVFEVEPAVNVTTALPFMVRLVEG